MESIQNNQVEVSLETAQELGLLAEEFELIKGNSWKNPQFY